MKKTDKFVLVPHSSQISETRRAFPDITISQPSMIYFTLKTAGVGCQVYLGIVSEEGKVFWADAVVSTKASETNNVTIVATTTANIVNYASSEKIRLRQEDDPLKGNNFILFQEFNSSSTCRSIEINNLVVVKNEIFSEILGG